MSKPPGEVKAGLVRTYAMGLSEYRKKRDFRRTAEPSGNVSRTTPGKRLFVVQKHAARRLHYDLRLEHDGVLKSWAVPKGPSLNPQEKRLAVEVEDHPLDYGSFEGTIPEGEYGAGTVLIWDRGQWTPADSDVATALRRGRLHFRLQGEKLKGNWNLVRLRDETGRTDKPTWLLIKSRDAEARGSEEDVVESQPDSVASHRTLAAVARASDHVWHSNRNGADGSPGSAPAAPERETSWQERSEQVRPMLATLADAPLTDPGLIYEPKYDGIRALIDLEPTPSGRSARVKIWSRLGNDKTLQFPEIVRVLASFGKRLKAGVLLDGEIVALDTRGRPAGFQHLQSRVHSTGDLPDRRASSPARVAFIAFDILRDGQSDLRPLPLVSRRARLERVLENVGSPIVRLSRFQPSDGTQLYREALEEGWEGLVTKQAASPYRSGKRSPEWRKLKILWQQECVIGGWTEPRESRTHIGALLLGVYDQKGLVYVGHTGTGFTEAELGRLRQLLRPLERPTSPFVVRPRTNERPHWVDPRLIAQVKFTEWTADGKLRHPVYLGLRDDVTPEQIRREPTPRLHARSQRLTTTEQRAVSRAVAPPDTPRYALDPSLTPLLEQLRAFELDHRGGVLVFPTGERLKVAHLDKVFWPEPRITKGELLRYYVEVSPFLLPAVQDRPLVMRRFPNGIHGKAFYQQRAPERVPPGVRVETLPDDEEVPSRLVGGSLVTLLYMAQLAVISQDPWFSRVQSSTVADYVALDLDPMPGVRWSQVLDIARWAREELERYGVTSFPKTSGASGLHIYIPLPAGTPYEPGRIFCQLIATVVAEKHPSVATVERSVHARGGRIYVDYLQNVHGKTLATAYSARASEFAGVSTPLTWEEVEEGARPEDFTIRTAVARFRVVGDLWAQLRQSSGVDFDAILARVGGP